MFDEVPVVGTQYKTGDWKLYAAANDVEIKGFFGEYRWLSNFHICRVWFEGLCYPSSENAFQAAKIYPEHRHPFLDCSAAQSKKLWKELPRIDKLSEDWDVRKYTIMSSVLFSKFADNLDLRRKLLQTGGRYLEETNHWGDTYWGVDIKRGGENRLGQLLMKIRDFWKEL